MITGNPRVLEGAVDLSGLGVSFTAKPILMGGLAMEYYGLRGAGADVDFIIADADYRALAAKYPASRKDMWGDLGLLIGKYELFRSVFRLDYDFFAVGAVECGVCKVLSFERLFFMKAIAFENQPEVEKHSSDFRLIFGCVCERFQNRDYVENAMKHTQSYLAAPDGTIYVGKHASEG